MARKSMSELRSRQRSPDVPPEDDPAETREGPLRWFFGWIVLPGLFLAALFAAGAHVGASNPDWWLTKLLVSILG